MTWRRGRRPPASFCRAVTPKRIDVSLHCHAPGSAPFIEAHLLAENVERELRAALPQLDHVTIHVEPAGSVDT